MKAQISIYNLATRVCVFAIALASTLIVLRNDAFATIYIHDVNTLHQASAAIALVVIHSAEEIEQGEKVCGTRYSATIMDPIKGFGASQQGDQISFGRISGLALDHPYLLYFEHWDSAADLITTTSNRPPYYSPNAEELLTKENIQFAQCGGLVPGHEYIRWAALPLLGTRFLPTSGMWPYGIPAEIIGDGKNRLTNGIPSTVMIPYLKSLTEKSNALDERQDSPR